ALHEALWSFFEPVTNKLDREQYRQLLAPKFVKDSGGEEYDERQKLRDESAVCKHSPKAVTAA
ncbi:hypothetical protein, partial [Pseudacidovorax intermedius]|uniref:hypothetical protein n=1 Tax=Pseudacidovorax intermedius TaxID=433924 RepID=UPI0019D355E0